MDQWSLEIPPLESILNPSRLDTYRDALWDFSSKLRGMEDQTDGTHPNKKMLGCRDILTFLCQLFNSNSQILVQYQTTKLEFTYLEMLWHPEFHCNDLIPIFPSHLLESVTQSQLSCQPRYKLPNNAGRLSPHFTAPKTLCIHGIHVFDVS